MIFSLGCCLDKIQGFYREIINNLAYISPPTRSLLHDWIFQHLITVLASTAISFLNLYIEKKKVSLDNIEVKQLEVGIEVLALSVKSAIYSTSKTSQAPF